MNVSVQSPGAAMMGRNGLSWAETIQICGDQEFAEIEAVNTKGRVTNGGIFYIPVKAMDELCEKWLEARKAP